MLLGDLVGHHAHDGIPDFLTALGFVDDEVEEGAGATDFLEPVADFELAADLVPELAVVC